MKYHLAALLMATAPALALAQARPAEPKPAPATTPKAAKAAKAGKADKPPALARSAQKVVEEVTPIEDDPELKMSPAELEIAKAVYVGEMKCELGAFVHVRPARREGLFVISTKGARFLMHPVESRTGAIRLEDPRRGAMWLQLGNKSMLMSQKQGRRLADECQGPEQVTRAEYLKNNPLPSLLDGQRPGMGPMGPGMGPAMGMMHRHGEAPAAAVAPSAPPSDPGQAQPALLGKDG